MFDWIENQKRSVVDGVVGSVHDAFWNLVADYGPYVVLAILAVVFAAIVGIKLLGMLAKRSLVAVLLALATLGGAASYWLGTLRPPPRPPVVVAPQTPWTMPRIDVEPLTKAFDAVKEATARIGRGLAKFASEIKLPPFDFSRARDFDLARRAEAARRAAAEAARRAEAERLARLRQIQERNRILARRAHNDEAKRRIDQFIAQGIRQGMAIESRRGPEMWRRHLQGMSSGSR